MIQSLQDVLLINRGISEQGLGIAHLMGCANLDGFTMALIQVGLDESGKLNDTEDICFGGCALASHRQYAFGEDWIAALDAAKVRSLHMAQAMRRKKEFQKFSCEERDSLLVELAGIAKKHSPLAVAALMTTKQFKQLPDEDQKRSRNPVYWGFEGCVNALLRGIPGAQGHSLQIACDLSEEYSGKILRLFHKLRVVDSAVKQCCHVISFADDYAVPLLQLADMYAYCCREYARGNPRPVTVDILEVLTGSREVRPSAHLIYTIGSLELGTGILKQ